MSGVGAVLLAAGGSTRLGRPKQLVLLGAENLLERSIRVLEEAHCSPIVVVLGASADLIRQHSRLCGTREIFNARWQEGMAGSIQAGLDALSTASADSPVNAADELDGVIVMVCDMPAVTSEHVRALAESGLMTGTSYAGRCGVPAYLPKSAFPALRKLKGDIGARGLLRSAASIPLPGGELDIDTEPDVEIAQRLFTHRST